MPTGPVNGESTSKTLRVPLKLSHLIEEISKRENRSYSNTVTTILSKYVHDYDNMSVKQFEKSVDIH